MRYRRRLRSRIILSFLLLGLGLTGLFATATVLLRERLEDQLIGEALVENLGDYADTFTLPSFTFRAIAGLVFSALYLVRGFGIVAWTHALYDVFLALSG